MKVRVPASSANLGPGFDCLGIAWQLYNNLEFDTECEGTVITGCDEIYRNTDNPAYISYDLAMKMAGMETGNLHIHFGRCDIPVTRGLGSSAALVVAGAVAANEINGLGCSDSDILDIATAVEGHPDNVAPALFGGMTANIMEEGRVYSEECLVSKRFCFSVLVPDFQVSTALARSVLPLEVAMKDAVFNLSRTVLVVRALETGDSELLRVSMKDRLHQEYRKSLIPGYDRAMSLAADYGLAGMCISGAGPAMLAVADDRKALKAFSEAAAEQLPGWAAYRMEIDRNGTQVLG